MIRTGYIRPADPQKELARRLAALPYVPTKSIRRQIGEAVAADYGVALDSVNDAYEREHQA